VNKKKEPKRREGGLGHIEPAVYNNREICGPGENAGKEIKGTQAKPLTAQRVIFGEDVSKVLRLGSSKGTFLYPTQ
jgi:hypothetical protein